MASIDQYRVRKRNQNASNPIELIFSSKIHEIYQTFFTLTVNVIKIIRYAIIRLFFVRSFNFQLEIVKKLQMKSYGDESGNEQKFVPLEKFVTRKTFCLKRNEKNVAFNAGHFFPRTSHSRCYYGTANSRSSFVSFCYPGYDLVLEFQPAIRQNFQGPSVFSIGPRFTA